MKFWPQFGLLLFAAGIGLLLTLIVSVPVLVLCGNTSVFAIHWMQWMQTIILMILAPLCWYRCCHIPAVRITEGKWRTCFHEAHLTAINWKFLFVTFCLMLAALPMMDSFEVFMNKLPWPESIHNYIMSGFEQNQKMIALLLQANGFWSNVECFLLMCLGTAIGEELMFRGALLSCFRNLTKLNIHAIAWIIGFIFALIHFEPAGFAVRMCLGALLVYLVYWSGSLWSAILAHCMNNSFALVGFKLATPEERISPVMDYTFDSSMTLVSLMMTLALLYVLWQMRVQKVQR